MPASAASSLACMSGAQADALSWPGETPMPSFLASYRTLPALGVPAAIGLEGVGHRELEVLLGAGQEARCGVRVGQELVDVDTDALDVGRARRVEDAVAGQAGDLEQDVDVLVLGEEVLGERLAAGLVLERAAEKSFVTYALTTLMSGLTDLAPSS